MDKQKFEVLKDILFEDARKRNEELTNKVKAIDDIISDREKLEPKIAPILEDQVEYLEKNFPSLFGTAITASIRKQIKESQDEVVDALYPIIGKMIKKYISRELALLSERIDRQLEKAFSWEGWVTRIKAWFGGISEKEMMMKELARPVLEEIFVIQQQSGMLIGSYSKNKTLDKDMIAGMLTAIKTFVQDAFQGGNQEVETIEYENYKIVINNLRSYYVVLVITGFMNTDFRSQLDEILVDFQKEVLEKYLANKETFSKDRLTQLIKAHFDKFNNGEK